MNDPTQRFAQRPAHRFPHCRPLAALTEGRAPVLAMLALAMASGCTPDKPAPAVEVELHMMSRCPFAGALLHGIVEARDQMPDRVNLKVHYIASNHGGDPTDLTSMYGPEDIRGDQVQLCARQVADDSAFLHFLACQQRQPELIPNNWPDCSKEAGVDPAKLSECVESPLAARLLQSSVSLSASRKISSSPTLLIDGKKHLGGRLRYHLERAICAAMAAPKHDYCDSPVEPPALSVRVITDPACQSKDCDLARFTQFLERNLPLANLETISLETDAGRAAYKKVGPTFLPVAIFDETLTKRPIAFKKLTPHVRQLEDNSGYVYVIGKTHLPKPSEPN